MNGTRKPEKIRLFIKPFCGWCHEVMDWFEARGIAFETLDVTEDSAAFREMKDLSGQTMAPVMEADGEILADFGADELEAWWKEKGFEI